MPGLYSSTGFDVLGVLSRVVTRQNPRTVLGPVDFSCSFLVVVRSLSQPLNLPSLLMLIHLIHSLPGCSQVRRSYRLRLANVLRPDWLRSEGDRWKELSFPSRLAFPSFFFASSRNRSLSRGLGLTDIPLLRLFHSSERRSSEGLEKEIYGQYWFVPFASSSSAVRLD